MGEAIIETRYYLTAWTDEVIVHKPTLAGAADLLRLGHSAHWTVEGGAPGEPMAADGDIVDLDTLELYANRVAVRETVDGAEVWALHPPAPADADFLAVRMGPSGGWSPEDIVPNLAGLSDILEPDDAGAIIAVGRHGDLRARFRLEGDTARLEPLPPGDADGEG